jgi:hypothetical protein
MTVLDPLPYNALAALRAEASVAPRPQARSATLAAVHAAVAAPPQRRRRRTGLLGALLRHPIALATTALAAAVAALITLGWNAPPGSVLHDVRLARERVALAFAPDPTALRLSYAEDRLKDAHNSSNPGPLLQEADDLLRQVQPGLSASATDPVRARWADDERQLSDERGGGSAPSGGSGPSGAPAGAGGAAEPSESPGAPESEDRGSGSGAPGATASPGEGEQQHAASPTGAARTTPTPGGDDSEHLPGATPGPSATQPPDN